MIIDPAARTRDVREYYFSRKNRQIAELNARRDTPVINLGIGSPDRRPPQEAIDTLCDMAQQDGVHAYQSYLGAPQLREAFARWYERYYDVKLDPSCEIQPLTGSKEGILLLSLAFLDKGDKVLVPDPGYPTYTSASRLCEAQILSYDLREEDGWMPDFDALEAMDLSGVKMMWTNYPNMPTGAPASRDLYERLVRFGLEHNILICNDNPYSFILNDKPLSILSVPRARECCVELNSLSKAHNMSGWRVGMIAGEREYVSELLKVKSQMDSGMFRPLQFAAAAALDRGPEWFEKLNGEYRLRKQAAARIFDYLGVKYNPDSQGLFLWGKRGADAEAVSDRLLEEAGVFITPGFIFGKNGREYLRISLCAEPGVFEEALERIRKVI
ncbi:MAG: aminotransferase class I/II-fold pyridoxal phosphate-dependent enzyme [Bacteroidales bacterium]|nr:aminotransferase class I/II-fold pyridoxal phosphate-dependent enzyme [Bacteroidales bacterium]MDD6751082.1 aminotransferase class I/II-fold pyridoxal phosphate-dependent enzyme [Bacteroidales bacterium]